MAVTSCSSVPFAVFAIVNESLQRIII